MSGQGSSYDISEDSDMGFRTDESDTKLTSETIDNFFFDETTLETRNAEYYNQSENHTLTVSESVYYSPQIVFFGGLSMIIIAIFAIIGNFISIWALSRSKKLRRVTTALIVNLCISNFFLSFFSLLSSIVIFRTRHWNGGDTSCKFYSIIMYFFTLMSMFTVTTIALNRYILIVHTKCYKFLFTIRNTAVIIGLLWIFPLVFTLLPLFKKWGMFGYDSYTGECAIIDHNGSSKIYMFFIAYIVPFILFILCYTKIFLVVRKIRAKTTKIANELLCIACLRGKVWQDGSADVSGRSNFKALLNQKEIRLFQMILVMFVCYVLCFIPLAVIKILHKEKEFPSLYVIFHLGVHLSNAINPILYVAMSKDYRKAYRDLFCGPADSHYIQGD